MERLTVEPIGRISEGRSETTRYLFELRSREAARSAVYSLP
jgi:hypothetical protein